MFASGARFNIRVIAMRVFTLVSKKMDSGMMKKHYGTGIIPGSFFHVLSRNCEAVQMRQMRRGFGQLKAQKEEGLTNLVPVLLPTVAVAIGTNASPGCE